MNALFFFYGDNVKNRIKKFHTKSTTDLINELTEKFDEVVFIGRNNKYKTIIAISQGDPFANIGMMDTLRLKINETI